MSPKLPSFLGQCSLGDQVFRWLSLSPSLLSRKWHDLWKMSLVLAQRYRGAEHLTTHWVTTIYHHTARLLSEWTAEVAVCVVRVRSFELLWRKLIHWWSVWWSGFLTEQGMTRLAASPAFQHTACVKLTQQNKAKFAFNMTLTIWGELLLYPGWSVVASMRFVSRRSIRISLSLITPPFSAAAWGKEEP